MKKAPRSKALKNRRGFKQGLIRAIATYSLGEDREKEKPLNKGFFKNLDLKGLTKVVANTERSKINITRFVVA